jgi:hypothetical protein
MPEQQSQRGNQITVAPFEAPFENQIVRYGRLGLNLKDSLDAMEGWSRLTNVWHQNEAEATARPGQTTVATLPAASTVHSIQKLRTPHAPPATRFWGAGTSLFRAEVGTPAEVATGFSGDPLALLPHRPTLSGEPWMFVGDRTQMLKVRHDSLALPIGLPAPSSAATSALGEEYRTQIAMCEEADSTDAANWTGHPGHDADGHLMGVPIIEDDPNPPVPGDGAVRFRTTADDATDTYDSWWGLEKTLNLSQLTSWPTPGTTIPASDDDIIHFWTMMSLPHLIQEIRLYFVVSEVFDPRCLPGTMIDLGGDPDDGTAANQDAYVKAFRRDDFTQFIQGRQSQIDAAEIARIHMLRDDDLADRVITDVRSTWEVMRAVKDPARKASLLAASGSYQWIEFGNTGVPLRRGDFQRIGVTKDRDWSTVTGVIFYVRTDIDDVNLTVVAGLDDLYLTGGRGPDTIEPGAQMYDYRYTHYDPRTGAESNPSPIQEDARTDTAVQQDAPIDTLRRAIVVDPEAYGDSAVRQRVYRRGGSLYDDWFYVGMNDADGATVEDLLADDAIAAAGTAPTDHFQPVPTLDANGNTVLAQPLRALWGPVEGMLLACGDPYRPGHAYWCLPDAPDHWSAFGNVEVCAPSEELMNGGLLGHQAFVFSRQRLYFLYPNLSGDARFTATPSQCKRGLFGYWSFAVGPGGVYFMAEDGIFVTQGGDEVWLSREINPIFYGTAVNGYQPIDKTKPTACRLTVWENDLYVLYEDLAGARQVMVYSILEKFWRHYSFGRSPACVQGEDEEILLLGGEGTGKAYRHDGKSDDGLAIACVARTGAISGGRREEKLFGDSFLDVRTGSVELTLQYFLNEETHANQTHTIANSTGRQRYIVDAFGLAPQKAHSISTDLRWSSSSDAPILYQFGIAITLQPDLTTARVTNWDDLGSPDEVWLTGITLDCDTGNAVKTINIERDFGGERILVATFTVTSANRHKFKFSWPAVPANMVRIRPDPECVPWLLYRADWIYQPEPPRIAGWDIHFENKWDQYYTGLDLYCDTLGQEKRIEVYVDEVRLSDPATSLPYWPVVAAGRQVVHLTLPWGRGHVFRFVAIDDHPGLLYSHRWHLEPEPSEQHNWNQNFSILGTRADKWLKAVIFECDTYGQDKQVQIEVDGTIAETLTVNTLGRKVVQLALSDQHLGRVWRMFPVDHFPGRLYSAQPIFDEEPFQLNRWETQESNHQIPGWFYPLYAHITLKSTADVTLTTTIQHNQSGGLTTDSYTIASTGGVKQRRFLRGFHATKGVLIKYVLTSAVPFWLYREETVVVIQPWGAADPITVHAFGNDDLDPTRTMTHAVLAATTSGGGTT